MKVLFISHPNKYEEKPDFPPIGLAYIGAIAKRDGHEVLLIDGGLLNIEKIVRQAKEFSPEFIGVTCWTINRAIVWRLINLLSESMPDAFLCVGGQHPTYYPEHIFFKTNAHAVVIGEGEDTISELLQALENRSDLSEVKGIILKRNDGALERTAPRPPVEQLDSIPFPYYEGFQNFTFDNYTGIGGADLPGPTAAVITSRGCVFDCTYCSSVNFWSKRWRSRSAENVLDEMELLVKKWGVRSIYIFDDNFPVNKKRAVDICQGIIDRKLNISWACCGHVKTIDANLLRVMKQSGCVSIDFGVESGSDIILKNINKGQSRIDIERTFALVHQAGIKPIAYLMVGNKGETVDTINSTIEMLGVVKPHLSTGASLLWLLPGTQVFKEARANNFISDDYWIKFDDVPYNLQEHSYQELFKLRQLLMWGIAKNKGGITPVISYYLKSVYYRFPKLSIFRALIPNWLR